MRIQLERQKSHLHGIKEFFIVFIALVFADQYIQLVNQLRFHLL